MTGAVPATWTAVLGWTLIHFLWRARVNGAGDGAGRAACRIRYAAGCFALLLM
jgi:hypothetical protein